MDFGFVRTGVCKAEMNLGESEYIHVCKNWFCTNSPNGEVNERMKGRRPDFTGGDSRVADALPILNFPRE